MIEKANQLMSAANSSMPPPSAPVSIVYTKTLVTKILSAKQGQILLFDHLCTVNNNNNNNFINLLKKAFQLNLQCQISKT